MSCPEWGPGGFFIEVEYYGSVKITVVEARTGYAPGDSCAMRDSKNRRFSR